MLHALITGKTRIKLLLRFFLNPNTSSYLREIASELNESTNSVRIELRRFAEAGFLKESKHDGKIYYCANKEHPLFGEIQSIVQKTLGVDTLMDELIKKVGNLNKAYIVGDYAKGMDCGLIDLVLVGREMDVSFIHGMSRRVEDMIGRKIRYLILEDNEEKEVLESMGETPRLLLWAANLPSTPNSSTCLSTPSK
jgi:predicted transcriptional regulator